MHASDWVCFHSLGMYLECSWWSGFPSTPASFHRAALDYFPFLALSEVAISGNLVSSFFSPLHYFESQYLIVACSVFPWIINVAEDSYALLLQLFVLLLWEDTISVLSVLKISLCLSFLIAGVIIYFEYFNL